MRTGSLLAKPLLRGSGHRFQFDMGCSFRILDTTYWGWVQRRNSNRFLSTTQAAAAKSLRGLGYLTAGRKRPGSQLVSVPYKLLFSQLFSKIWLPGLANAI